jgi:hypothetical protein
MIMTKLTVTDIADEILKVDLDGEALAVAMEELHNRVVSEGPGIGTQYVRLIRPQSWSLFRSDMLSASQMQQPTMNDSTRKASRFMNMRYG